MEISNLTSGFIGAIAAVILQKVYEYTERQSKLSSERTALKAYLSATILTSLKRYKIELTSIQQQVQKYSGGNIPTQNFDLYLSLSSEMLRSISYSDAFQKLDDEKAYGNYIDLCYAIDYLKRELPFDHLKRYFEEFGNMSPQRKDTLFTIIKLNLEACDSAIEETIDIISVLGKH